MTQSKSKLWTRPFIFVFAGNFLLFFSFQLLVPTLPLYVSSLGGKHLQIGLLMSLFTGASLLTRPFAGYALDRFRMKSVYLVGFCLCLAAVLLYGAAKIILWVFVLRILHGAGWGIATTSLGTSASNTVPGQRRGEGMGIFGISSTIALALAPLTGLTLEKYWGFPFLFGTAAGLLSLSLAAVLLIPAAKTNKEQPSSLPRTKSQTNRLLEKTSLFPSFLLFLTALCYGGIGSFLPLFGKEQGISNIGWFYLVNAAMVILVRPLSGKWYDQKGPSSVLFPGAFFTLVGLFVLSFSSNNGTMLISAVLYGIGFGSLQPTLLAWTIDRSSSDRRGAANAMFYSANDLGIGLGSLLLGSIAGILDSYAWMYRLSTIAIAVFLICYCLYHVKSDKNKKKAAQQQP